MNDTPQTSLLDLPHGIRLSLRTAGRVGDPVMVFLHGFPEGAFVWDALLVHFAAAGYRCVAPNLRGFERSSSPADAKLYRAKHLVQDIAALIDWACAGEPNPAAGAAAWPAGRLAALVAHDWGGAVAWNLANQQPERLAKLVILNSPHPGTFLRELKSNPEQQAASAYMNFLVREDAPALLEANDFARLWPFFTEFGGNSWLSDAVKERYREVWRHGLNGGCNYYRASPLRPPSAADAGAGAIELPLSMLTIDMPTQVIWGLEDRALPPCLLDGLDAYIPQLELHRVPGASHWIVHEQPELVAGLIGAFMAD